MPLLSFRRRQPISLFLLLAVRAAVLFFLANSALAVRIRTGADPTIVKVGDTYYSAESADGSIFVRAASSIERLGASDVRRERVWSDDAGRGDVWAPEMTTTTDGGGGSSSRTLIYFSAGRDAAHRMYFISADGDDSPLPVGDGAAYSTETKLALPDDQWAIDGIFFVFEGQGWFVWSGWASERDNSEQNLYICRMDSPTRPIGPRYIISQPREAWELGDSPRINEGPEAVVDPNGQLHIVYSANGSWRDRYCLADLRLRKGGDPTYVWDWYKSNGCLFGSHQERMMDGWDATLYIDGPGHHTFALPEGDVGKSPGGTNHIPFVFHGVEKGVEYSWGNRAWFTGSYVWWNNTTYRRQNVPGEAVDTGYSFKFFE